MNNLVKTGDYGYYGDFGAVIGDAELVIVHDSNFNNGEPCIIPSNTLIRKGIFIALPQQKK